MALVPVLEFLGQNIVGLLLDVGNKKYYNMKIKMNSFSRKLVLFLVILFTQSSLGTNAALKDFSNVSTKSLSQNGYYKLPDGLMIQWGYATASTEYKTVYMSTSFYDENYAIIVNPIINGTTYVVIVANVRAKYKSYFQTVGRAAGISSIGLSTEPLYWIAIGRWK